MSSTLTKWYHYFKPTDHWPPTPTQYLATMFHWHPPTPKCLPPKPLLAIWLLSNGSAGRITSSAGGTAPCKPVVTPKTTTTFFNPVAKPKSPKTKRNQTMAEAQPEQLVQAGSSGTGQRPNYHRSKAWVSNASQPSHCHPQKEGEQILQSQQLLANLPFISKKALTMHLTPYTFK